MFNLKKDVKILVVDDEPEILRTLKRILSKKGYEVVTIESALEALEYLKTNRVNLIMTDLKMPGMDGIQFLDKIKNLRLGVATILITGYATIETAVRAIQLGAYNYVCKPFDIKKIYEVVEQALESTNQK